MTRSSRRVPVAHLLMVLMPALVVTATSGCGDSTDNDTGEVTVTERDAEISVTVGERFDIVLESNATTGYAWAEADATDVVELVDDEYLPPDTELVGAGGLQRLTFEAVAAGSAELQLWYVRSFDDPKEPADEARFPVEVIEP